MRVSQQMLFSQYVNNMNRSLTDLLELNLQTQTQKKINRPSDNPVGMVRVLDHRDTLRSIEQYKENISTAKGWLGRSDSTLLQASTLITRAVELAEQGSSGTMSEANREQISYEMRQIFEQLVALGNTEFENKSIYAGQKTDGNAFQEVLWMTTNDATLNANSGFTVEGSSKNTVLVQFYTDDGSAIGSDMALNDPNLKVRYSKDGGDSFQDGTITVANGQARIDLPNTGTALTFHNAAANVKLNDPNSPNNTDGTWCWLRPSAQYLGDDRESIHVDSMGTGTNLLNTSAAGHFYEKDAIVRIDNSAAVTMDQQIEYSYSMDGGMTWVTGNKVPADSTASNAVITVPPGGTLTLSSNGSNQLQPGSQFVIRPRSASIDVRISLDEEVRVNDVGMEIWGGIYQDPDAVMSAQGSRLAISSSNASPALDNGNGASTLFISNGNMSKNLYETMGNLVAFLETNTQTGVQQSLANLRECQSHILTMAADVGGREHRCEVASTIAGNLELNEKERLSAIEDVDVGELMMELTQQQIVYESVLRSTSMIMNTNLMKFV